MKGKMHQHKHDFFGVTTIGERGQVVIPIEARNSLSVEKGEKLLVLGFGDDAIILAKVSKFRKLFDHFSKKQKEIGEILKKI